MTAAMATAGWRPAASSRSMELIHSPPDLMRSFTRSVICMTPSGWSTATSPVGNQPSLSALPGSGILEKLKSVVQMGKAKGDVPLPENESVHAGPVVELRKGLGRNEVRQGQF